MTDSLTPQIVIRQVPAGAVLENLPVGWESANVVCSSASGNSTSNINPTNHHPH